MKRHLASGLLVLLCAAPAVAESADHGFYLGVEIGQSSSDVGPGGAFVVQRGTLTGTSTDGEDSAYGAYLGYAVSRHFSVELSYADLGEVRYTEERDVPPPAFPVPTPPFVGGVTVIPEREETTIASESLSLAVIGRYALTETLSLTGRAGLAVHRLKGDLRFWFREDEVTVINGAFEQSGGAALLGAGLEWDFHPRWHARLQIQQHFMLEDEELRSNVARGDVATYTAGVGYRF